MGDDPVADIRLFAVAPHGTERDVLNREIRREVEAIQRVTQNMDAFDLIELLRLRELPIAPVLGLAEDYDGSVAALELIALVLLCRDGRGGPTFDASAHPHLVIDELHDRAVRLLRLTGFMLLTRFGQSEDPFSRLALDYQMHALTVRSMQFDSVQARHDEVLFGRPEITVLLRANLGFDYSEFQTVRQAIQSRFSRTVVGLRDGIDEIMLTTKVEEREPTPEELRTFHDSMRQWMFYPGQRAAFTAEDIAAECSMRLARVEAVLSVFSIGFSHAAGDAVHAVRGFLRGENPLARTCLVRDEEGHLIMTSMQIGDDSFRSIFEATLRDDAKAEGGVQPQSHPGERAPRIGVRRTCP